MAKYSPVWILVITMVFVVFFAVLKPHSTYQIWPKRVDKYPKEIMMQNNLSWDSNNSGYKKEKSKHSDKVKILKKTVSELIFKTMTKSETEVYSNVFKGNIDNVRKNKYEDSQNQNRTYEHLLEKLQLGTYTFCADMFARKLYIPWDEQQELRELKFLNAFELVLHDAILGAYKVGEWNFFIMYIKIFLHPTH